MDHLDVVTGTIFTDPVTAGLTLCLCSGLLEDLLDCGPGGGVSTRHQRRTIPGPLFTTRHTGPNEQQALSRELLDTACGVGVMGVTTVDDDVTLLEMRLELLDESVDGGTSLDEEDNLARGLELCDELLDRVCALDFCAYG